jgi:hypothetical protein
LDAEVGGRGTEPVGAAAAKVQAALGGCFGNDGAAGVEDHDGFRTQYAQALVGVGSAHHVRPLHARVLERDGEAVVVVEPACGTRLDQLRDQGGAGLGRWRDRRAHHWRGVREGSCDQDAERRRQQACAKVHLVSIEVSRPQKRGGRHR